MKINFVDIAISWRPKGKKFEEELGGEEFQFEPPVCYRRVCNVLKVECNTVITSSYLNESYHSVALNHQLSFIIGFWSFLACKKYICT